MGTWCGAECVASRAGRSFRNWEDLVVCGRDSCRHCRRRKHAPMSDRTYDVAIIGGGHNGLTCAAYLARAGTPASIDDLARHECLLGTAPAWHFHAQGKDVTHRPAGRWRCNSGTAVTEAALAGHGVCQLPDFYVMPHLQSGALVSLLDPLRPQEEPIWAVYPQRRHLLPKVRLLIDKLREELPGALRRSESVTENRC